MSIHVGTVYNTVQALANKEQRGYLTPQEFNRFAHLATREIFEQYFYDLNQFNRTPGNSTEYADMVDLLESKITKLRTRFTAFNLVGGFTALPQDLYRVGAVFAADITSSGTSNRTLAEQVTREEAMQLNALPLTQPIEERPIFFTDPLYTSIQILPTSITGMEIQYLRKPAKAKFGYIVINKKPVYASDRSTDFDLHQSEFPELVYKILGYAGINLKRSDIEQAGQIGQAKQVQQEKI